jgi:hypothetical protein
MNEFIFKYGNCLRATFNAYAINKASNTLASILYLVINHLLGNLLA